MRPYRNWLRTVAEMFRSNPLVALVAMALALVLGLQPAASFYAFSHLIDALIQRTGGRIAARWLLLLALITLLDKAGQRVRPVLRFRLAQDAELRLTERLLARAGQMPLLAFESPAFYDRYASAQRAVRESLGRVIDQINQISRNAVTAVTTVIVLASLHWGAAAILVLGGGPAWFFQAAMVNKWVAMYRRQVPQGRRTEYLAGLLTQRSYVGEIRLFGLGRFLLDRWRVEATRLRDERINLATQRGIAQVAALFGGDLAFAGSLAVLALSTIAGRISPGQLAAAMETARNLQDQVMGTLTSAGMLQQDAQLVTDLWDFIDGVADAPAADSAAVPEMTRAPAAAADGMASASVQFEGVSFRYPGAARPTLTDISFDVEPGEVIALVGENGAGKSTLVKLLLGLYPPEAGHVWVNGVEASLPVGTVTRTQMASVFQESLRYALTAGENIGVGEVVALHDRARIRQAAVASGADTVLDALPAGMETLLGREFEGGQDLSGGQWQKLAIARAHMRQPAVLVLDEPTAALDPLAELEVFRQFRALSRGRTVFFISHRLGAARLADRIFVLKQGRLIEEGNHEQLLAREGEYAALFKAQADWYTEPAV